MKQLLPWIKNAKALFADPQKQNQIFHRLCGMALAVLIMVLVTLPAHSQINDDGNSHGVSAIGTYADYVIPNNNQIVAISFNLVGGDGGYAEVTGTGGAKANGGQGATATATFPVGSGAGQIPVGSTIRFVVGAKGTNGSSAAIASVGIDYGGGGGGSAVLYNPPGPIGWTLLAVAGGGGGAYVGTGIGIKDRQHGQGGRETAGNGSGGGGNIAFGGGGGGKNSGGGGVSCVDINVNFTSVGGGGAGGNGVGAGGYDEGCYNLTWRNGGAGYGGGGAGSGVGGGGGGYTGGAAGPAKQNGSGGGSYVNSLASYSIKTGGGTDGSPDNGTITYQVTLNQPPVAVCKVATLYLDADGKATLAPDDIDGGSSDPDGTITNKAVSQTNFTCANVGDNQVTLTVTDNNGASDDCQITVTVIDDIDPVAECQNITVYLDASGLASITADMIDNGSTDNCSIASKLLDVYNFSCADVNTSPNPVTLTVEDPSGNSDDCNATVTVLDTVSPVAICQDITVQLDATGNVSITATDIDNGSTEACGIASYAASKTDFICADVGPNTVLLTVTDNNGNTSTCTSTVTVEDNVPPVALCNNITIQLDAFGEASIVATDIDNGSNDACGIDTYAANKIDFTCANLGNNNVVLTVTDVNGNSSTCNANVLVEDNLKPLVRTRNVTVTLDEHGEGYVTPDMINDGSTDNCSINYIWLEGETEYDCGNAGVHEVVCKVRDQSGNIGSYNAFVTVKFYEPDFKNIHGLANGDTVHVVDCQVPWDISRYDLDYETIIKHGTLTTHVYKEELPENAPWGMYALWRYEYVVKDACAHTYKFNYYLALYDLAPPVYQCFPNDTTVATSVDVPPVDMKVKIIDICQYAVWDTVITMPVLNPENGDTLGYTRRWMARDPSGHESFKDQMIWLGSGDRKQYSLITGRIADEDHIRNAHFPGEAGTNGLPVSLYRIDEAVGTRTWVNSWTTGDWMGAQGTYYFVPKHPGQYQVKIDTAICLVDTLKFNKELWSDTLTVAAGDSLDQGWVITHPCIGTEVVNPLSMDDARLNQGDVQMDQYENKAWNVYPNPASDYLKININSEHVMNYHIFDALGRSVKTGIYQRGQTIDIDGLNAGLYHLQLRDEKKILGTKKVLLME